MVLAVEQDYSAHCEGFLPILIELLITNSNEKQQQDWTVRKMAIDVIYTFAAILKEKMAEYK